MGRGLQKCLGGVHGIQGTKNGQVSSHPIWDLVQWLLGTTLRLYPLCGLAAWSRRGVVLVCLSAWELQASGLRVKDGSRKVDDVMDCGANLGSDKR